MALTPGTRLGVYDITAAIGEGGMGQVYRATDARLKRQVAIKVLPPSLAVDADRLARFQREAEVLASLNHPNIAAIYGLEESGGMTALVMELVEGDDLSQRIARGAIPLDDALPIAKQIAEALEAAHEQGIIHRDLKPANIKVRGDGTVKVLDFGLARAMDPAAASGANVANSPTLTAHATALGMIMGTAAYMAPEQAKGKTVDRRADIWAFGVVLYEMLTGRAAFAGDTVTDIIAAVVTREPDWTACRPPHRRRSGGCWRAVSRGIRSAACATSATSGWKSMRPSRVDPATHGLPSQCPVRLVAARGRQGNSPGQCWGARWAQLLPPDWHGPACGHARARPSRTRSESRSFTPRAAKWPHRRSRPTAGASPIGHAAATGCRCSGCGI